MSNYHQTKHIIINKILQIFHLQVLHIPALKQCLRLKLPISGVHRSEGEPQPILTYHIITDPISIVCTAYTKHPLLFISHCLPRKQSKQFGHKHISKVDIQVSLLDPVSFYDI